MAHGQVISPTNPWRMVMSFVSSLYNGAYQDPYAQLFPFPCFWLMTCVEDSDCDYDYDLCIGILTGTIVETELMNRKMNEGGSVRKVGAERVKIMKGIKVVRGTGIGGKRGNGKVVLVSQLYLAQMDLKCCLDIPRGCGVVFKCSC